MRDVAHCGEGPAACSIQRMWRCYAARRLVAEKRAGVARERALSEVVLWNESAQCIQGMWLARRRRRVLEEARDAAIADAVHTQHSCAASTVQHGWRASVSRGQRRLSQQTEHTHLLQHEAAELIQSFFRGCTSRGLLHAEPNNRGDAVRLIEAWYTVRMGLRGRRSAYDALRATEAAVLIQKHTRRRCQAAATQTLLLSAREARRDVVVVEAAHYLQRMGRCFLANAETGRRRTAAGVLDAMHRLVPTLQRVGRACHLRENLAHRFTQHHITTLQRLGRGQHDRISVAKGRSARRGAAVDVLYRAVHEHILGRGEIQEAQREIATRKAYRALEARYEREDNAATVLTLFSKRQLALREVARRRGVVLPAHLGVMQRAARCFLARQHTKSRRHLHIAATTELLAAQETQHTAYWHTLGPIAVHIQRLFRGYSARCAVRERIAKKTIESDRVRAEDAAELIQAAQRGHATRLRLRAERVAVECATVLQTACRGRLSVQRVRGQIVLRHCNVHASVVQRAFKCHYARQVLQWRRDDERSALLAQRSRIAATLIQRNYRRHLAVHTVHRMHASERLHNHSALRLQRLFRGFLARKHEFLPRIARAAAMMEGLLIESAALEVTRTARGAVSRMRTRNRRTRMVTASTTIQRVYRGMRGRTRADITRHALVSSQIATRRELAAIEIQSLWRMVHARQTRTRLSYERRQAHIEKATRERMALFLQCRGRAIPIRLHLGLDFHIKTAAAVAIQRIVKGRMARGQIVPLRRQRLREACVSKIQRVWRGERVRLRSLLEIREMEVRIHRINLQELCRAEGQVRIDISANASETLLTIADDFRAKITAYLKRISSSVSEEGLQLYTIFLETQSRSTPLHPAAAKIQTNWRCIRARKVVHTLRSKRTATTTPPIETDGFSALSTTMVHRTTKCSDLLYFNHDPEREERIRKGREATKPRRNEEGENRAVEIDWRAAVVEHRKQNPALVTLLYEEEARRGEITLFHRCVLDDLRARYVNAALRSKYPEADREPPHLHDTVVHDIVFNPSSSDAPKGRATRRHRNEPVVAKNVSDTTIAACVGGNVVMVHETSAFSFANYSKQQDVPVQAPKGTRTLLPLKYAPDVGFSRQVENDIEEEIGLVAKAETIEQLEALVRQVSMDDPMVRKIVVRGMSLRDADVVPLLKTLRFSTNVREIDMSQNPLSDATAEGLAAVLVANNSIASIDLSHTHITEMGVTHLTAAVYTNPTLVALALHNTLAPRQVLATLSERLKAKSVSLLPGGRVKPRRPAPHAMHQMEAKNVPFYKRRGVPAATLGATLDNM